MAQLDPSIILQAGKPQAQDFATTLGQIGQLRAQQAQSQFQGAQLDQIQRQNTTADADRATALSAGQKFAQGDFSGAVGAAAQGGNFTLAKSLTDMNDTQRKQTFAISQQTAPALLQLKTLAPEMRPAALQHIAPQLMAAGLTPDHIASIDTSDQGLDSIGAGAQTIEQFMTQQNKNRDFGLETAKFGHTVTNDAQLRTQAAATAAETSRHNMVTESTDKPVSVGFGSSLVDPTTGKVVYNGGSAGGNGSMVENQAKAIAEYRLSPPTGRAAVSGPGAAIMDRVTQLNPTYDGTRFHERNAAMNAFGPGKLGSQTRSLNVAVDHLDQLGSAATALGNGNVPLFNSIGQTYAQQSGSAAPTNFDGMRDIVMNEVVKGVVGAGGGVSDRDKAAAIVSRANSPAQLSGAIKQVQGLMGGQLRGLGQQYKDSTGLDNFNEKLSPRTSQVLGSSAPSAATSPATSAAAIPPDIAAILAKHGPK